METDKTLPTNYHYVLWYDVERTILIKHAPFERHVTAFASSAPKWLYFSSLGENTEAFHHEISAWLAQNPETKLAFQPGTFQIKLGKEKLKDIYARTNIFFCNFEEAERILDVTDAKLTETIEGKKKLMDMIAALGAKIVVMTDGIRAQRRWNISFYADISAHADRAHGRGRCIRIDDYVMPDQRHDA